MNRHALLPLLFVAACARDERPGLPPRHFVLVTVEGLRADHTSIELYPRETTAVPVDGGQHELGRALGLDDLSEEGVVFARAFAPSNDPVVSLASLMVGASPFATGPITAGGALPEDRPTLAERLAALGVRPFAFVTQPGPLPSGIERGFESFAHTETDVTTLGQALSWAGEVDFATGAPTFLWLHLRGPAFPFEATVGPAGGGGTIDFGALYSDPGYQGEADGSAAFRERAGESALAPADRDEVVARYDAEINRLTHLLFAFLDFYRYAGEPSGAWSQSVFAFAGTGGLELFDGDGAWGTTDSLRDAVLRVPLFVRHPDSLTGRRIFAEVVELQDLHPTLVELAGGEPPSELDSRSLLALTDSWRPRTFASRPARALSADGAAWSWRTPDWHLVGERDGSRRLYHSRVDRRELRDVAASEPERVRELQDSFEAGAAGARGE